MGVVLRNLFEAIGLLTCVYIKRVFQGFLFEEPMLFHAPGADAANLIKRNVRQLDCTSKAEK